MKQYLVELDENLVKYIDYIQQDLNDGALTTVEEYLDGYKKLIEQLKNLKEPGAVLNDGKKLYRATVCTNGWHYTHADIRKLVNDALDKAKNAHDDYDCRKHLDHIEYEEGESGDDDAYEWYIHVFSSYSSVAGVIATNIARLDTECWDWYVEPYVSEIITEEPETATDVPEVQTAVPTVTQEEPKKADKNDYGRRIFVEHVEDIYDSKTKQGSFWVDISGEKHIVNCLFDNEDAIVHVYKARTMELLDRYLVVGAQSGAHEESECIADWFCENFVQDGNLTEVWNLTERQFSFLKNA